MIPFTSFLAEAAVKKTTKVKKAPKEKEFNLNDAKGKLYEILLGSHLHHGTNKKGRPNDFLSHFRDEEGKSPKDVHNSIAKEIEYRHPGMYDEINNHAMAAAKQVRAQLAAAGHREINNTVWTSQKGDHKKFTGREDPNSDADLMVATEHGPIGLSLKYGESKDMNLRNPGLDTLEKAAGLQKGELSELRDAHYNRVRNELGIRDHAHYKQLKNDKRAKGIVDAANDSALAVQRTMAKKISDGLAARAEQDPEFLRSYVRQTVAPKTTYQHFRIHTRPDSTGNASHHMTDMQDDAAKLDAFDHFRVVPHDGQTISYRIEGRRKGSDRYEPVLDQGIKKGSGPMKGFAGMTKAPFLTRTEKQDKAAAKRSSKRQKVEVQDTPSYGGRDWNSPAEMREKNGQL